MSLSISFRFIQVNKLSFHVAVAGPNSGSPVILLHGFPDASFGWEKQIQALAQAGFYVIAPDQRGYNLSDKPRGVRNYTMDLLVADSLALADALGFKQFDLAGHDFGALVSWNLVESHPERVKRLAILNVPHPRILNHYLRVNQEQRSRSWYAYFFKLPGLPEMGLRAFNWKVLVSPMARSLSAADLARYRTAWSQPGAITSMVNWYRALRFKQVEKNPAQNIEIPTLMIWGKLDPHLMWQMAPESIALCNNGRLELVEDATHWVHQDKPEEVNRLLIDHFNALP